MPYPPYYVPAFAPPPPSPRWDDDEEMRMTRAVGDYVDDVLYGERRTYQRRLSLFASHVMRVDGLESWRQVVTTWHLLRARRDPATGARQWSTQVLDVDTHTMAIRIQTELIQAGLRVSNVLRDQATRDRRGIWLRLVCLALPAARTVALQASEKMVQSRAVLGEAAFLATQSALLGGDVPMTPTRLPGHEALREEGQQAVAYWKAARDLQEGGAPPRGVRDADWQRAVRRAPHLRARAGLEYPEAAEAHWRGVGSWVQRLRAARSDDALAAYLTVLANPAAAPSEIRRSPGSGGSLRSRLYAPRRG